MKRRTFIKNTLPLAFSPLFIESMIRQKVSEMFGFDFSPADFKDRKLVILNMFGGNDGLNNVIPMDQYDLYANHRPTIKINQPDLINLDGTLASNKQIGLNPALAEFKTLYDEGKLNVIQSVGYPTPNFSHFRSDNLIFGAKDGSYTSDVTRGWMSNYLATVFPSFNDRRTSQYPHPLGIQIGLNYKHNGYLHDAYSNIGININNLARNNFYNQLRSPDNSEFRSLLEYLKQIELASDVYKQKVEESFNAGTNMNGSTLYPNTDLGRQLKTLARLINGGIETKILTAFRGGFDVHSSQLVKHNPILEDVSKAVYAFQRDIEAQGVDDKIILITISEFGRQIVENGNGGTDHGSLSPWFVIGSPVKGGVTGRNIDLNLINGHHTADVLQHDYRRILSTIIQDWFGNTDSTLEQVGLDAFGGSEETPNGKLDIIKDNEVVTDTTDTFSQFFLDEFNLVEVKTVDGWTYYGKTATAETYVFAIEHRPNGGNSNTFVPQIAISDLLDDGTGKDYYKHIQTNRANFIFGKTWNITLTSGTLTGFVNMRFFLNKSRLDRVNQLATNFHNLVEGEKSNALWIKTTDSLLNPSTDFNNMGLTKAIEGVGSATYGIFENQSYYQFDEVTNFNNRGGAICHVVTDNFSTFTHHEKPGTIIFTQNGKMYGFNGTEWKKLFN